MNAFIVLSPYVGMGATSSNVNGNLRPHTIIAVNENEITTWVFRTEGRAQYVLAADDALLNNADNWLVKEIILFLKRTFKRLDVSSRSLITLVEPGSCFTGTLMELVLAADRSYMLDGVFEGSNVAAATLKPTKMNFGYLPMCNDLSRLETRFLNNNKKRIHI